MEKKKKKKEKKNTLKENPALVISVYLVTKKQ